MNNELIQRLADKTIVRIKSVMESRFCGFTEARAIVAQSSINGSAVWALVDAHFAA